MTNQWYNIKKIDSVVCTYNTRLGGESSSIRTTCASLQHRWILIRLATSMSLKSSYSSRLVWIRQSSSTLTGPKILSRTFQLHRGLTVSMPQRHVEVRFGSALQSLNFVAPERSLLLNCLLRPKQQKNKIKIGNLNHLICCKQICLHQFLNMISLKWPPLALMAFCALFAAFSINA